MPKISRSFTDPAYSRLFQGTADYFDYTQDNYDNDYFKGSMNNATEGKFKAVIISGLISGETAGTGGDYTQDIQQVKTGKNIKYKVKVRPIGVTHGTTLPDPCNEELDPKTRMKLVMAHPWALSDFNHDLDAPQLFAGQIVNCYYKQGTVGNGNYSQLRFSKPLNGMKSWAINAKCLSSFGLKSSNMTDLFTGRPPTMRAQPGGGSGGGGGTPQESNCSSDKPVMVNTSRGLLWEHPDDGLGGPETRAVWKYLKIRFEEEYPGRKIKVASIFRGQGDQNRIIRNYARSKGYAQHKGGGSIPDCPTQSQLNSYHKFLTQERESLTGEPNLWIGRRVGHGHGGKVNDEFGKSAAMDVRLTGGQRNPQLRNTKKVIDKIREEWDNGIQNYFYPNPGSGLNRSILEMSNGTFHLGFWLPNVNVAGINALPDPSY